MTSLCFEHIGEFMTLNLKDLIIPFLFLFFYKLTPRLLKLNTLTHDWIQLTTLGGIVFFNNTLRGGTTNYRSYMMRSAKPKLHRNNTLQMQTWRTTTKQEQSSPDISFNKPELHGMKKPHPSGWKSTWHKREPHTVSSRCTKRRAQWNSPREKNKACAS